MSAELRTLKVMIVLLVEYKAVSQNRHHCLLMVCAIACTSARYAAENRDGKATSCRAIQSASRPQPKAEDYDEAINM